MGYTEKVQEQTIEPRSPRASLYRSINEMGAHLRTAAEAGKAVGLYIWGRDYKEEKPDSMPNSNGFSTTPKDPVEETMPDETADIQGQDVVVPKGVVA